MSIEKDEILEIIREQTDWLKLQSIEFEKRIEIERQEREKERQERLKKEQAYEKRLEKERQERIEKQRAYEERLEKERQEREKERKISQKEWEKRDKALEKKISKLSNSLGEMVENMVEPNVLKMFQKHGIEVTESIPNVKVYNKDKQIEAEIDLLLTNSKYAVAIEIKTTLKVPDVDAHLKRLDKIQKNPPRFVRDTKLIGAVAGMNIASEADKYAMRKGLFVLKQTGEIVSIANDEKFKPKEWEIEP